jgi:hypothetical protein
VDVEQILPPRATMIGQQRSAPLSSPRRSAHHSFSPDHVLQLCHQDGKARLLSILSTLAYSCMTTAFISFPFRAVSPTRAWRLPASVGGVEPPLTATANPRLLSTYQSAAFAHVPGAGHLAARRVARPEF